MKKPDFDQNNNSADNDQNPVGVGEQKVPAYEKNSCDTTRVISDSGKKIVVTTVRIRMVRFCLASI